MNEKQVTVLLPELNIIRYHTQHRNPLFFICIWFLMGEEKEKFISLFATAKTIQLPSHVNTTCYYEKPTS